MLWSIPEKTARRAESLIFHKGPGLLPIPKDCGNMRQDWVYPPSSGHWYLALVGSHMHCAVAENVSDFPKNCRSVRLDPFSSFLYWHMEYHVEHHMYAAIPCYNLKKFRRFILQRHPGALPEIYKIWPTLNLCHRLSKQAGN